jgi:hypothetical protein
MHEMKRLTAVGLALVLVAAAACGGGDSSGTIAGPTGTVVTDTFTGTVALPVAGVFQADIHPFTVAVAGTVSVTLVSAGPPPTITMGLAIGNPSSTGGCSILSGGSTTTSASATAQLSGTLAAGAYCVAVVDIGNALQPVVYTVTVAHT